MDDSLLLGEVCGTDSQSSGSDDWQTDWNTDNQEDKGVVEQVDGRALGSGDLQVAEETADPGNENPTNDQNQERRANGVHDSLEVTLILCSRDESCSATDERHLGRVGDNAESLSTLATGSVVDDICDVLVNREGFSSHGRLINGKKSVARAVFLVSIIILVLALCVTGFATLSFEFGKVGLVSVGVVICADNSGISGNDLTIFDDNLDNWIND